MTHSTLEAMKLSRRWLLWRLYADGRKIPFYANGKPRSGPLDSPEDVAQLVYHWEALEALKRAGQGYELGFALGPDGNGGYWHGIDLDNVISNGLNDPANALPGYVELSPSGNGAHAIGYGPKFDNMGSDGSGIEAYSTGRYFTFTGNMIKDCELCDLSTFISNALAPRRKVPPARQMAASQAGQLEYSGQMSVDASTVEQLRSALPALDANSYQVWINTGIALKTLGEQGRVLWFEWSAKSPKFNMQDAECKWVTFKPENTSYKAVFAEAQRNGWRNPGYSQDVHLIDIRLPNPFMMKAGVNPSRFQLLGDADIEALPPMQWRIRNILPAQGIAAIYGASGNGKSFLAFDMACAIAAGQEWFGCRVKPAFVFYVSLEGEAGVKSRVQAWKRHNRRALPNGLRVMLQPFRLNDPLDVADFAAICLSGCVIFIDTLNRAAPGMDENSSKDMGAVIEGTKTLQRLVGGLVVTIAHTGKDSTKGLRGHSSMFAALDAAIIVSRDGCLRSWKVDKSKDGKDGEEHRFRLNVVELGADEDGEAITSCVILPDYTPATASTEKPLTVNQKMGMESFREAASIHGGLDEQGNFIGLHLNNWRPIFYRMSPADSESAKRKAFERVRKDLSGLGQITVENDIYRLAGNNAPIVEKCIAEALKKVRDKRQDSDNKGHVALSQTTLFGTTATTPL
jgi:hypothetical protein